LITSPNRDIGFVSLNLSWATALAFAAADADLLSFHLPYARRGWRSAADYQGILLGFAAASGASHDLLVSSLAHNEWASAGSVVVFTEKVRSTPACIITAAELEI